MAEPTETPAATLRRAAALMRERAALVPPSPWFLHERQITTDDGLNVIADSGLRERSQYLASWHPGVALALADWLDATAARAERTGALAQHALSPGPLAVALAYLGEQDGAR